MWMASTPRVGNAAVPRDLLPSRLRYTIQNLPGYAGRQLAGGHPDAEWRAKLTDAGQFQGWRKLTRGPGGDTSGVYLRQQAGYRPPVGETPASRISGTLYLYFSITNLACEGPRVEMNRIGFVVVRRS